jgi:hypothetical protein
MDSVNPAADARQEAPEKPTRWVVGNSPMGGTSFIRVADIEYVIANEIDAVLLADLHNAALDEIARLQAENATYRENYGPLCTCGHPQKAHYTCGCLKVFCPCTGFMPITPEASK